MTASAARFRTLARAFSHTIDAVPAEAWANPSPCEGWSAREVVRHVVTTEADFLRQHDLAVPAVDEHTDPVQAWPVVRDAVQAALDDDQVAGRTYDGWFGPTTIAATIDTFYGMDLVIHRWDLARAAGLADHETIPADEIDRIRADAAGFGEGLRMPGVCGPEVPVPAGASAQDRLLGFLGRRA
jgi:uncharacterized protein (TIGR03086 family)